MFLKKNILFLLLISTFFVACNNASTEEATTDTNGEKSLSSNLVVNPNTIEDNADMTQTGLLVFADTVHDFGELTEGEKIQHEFEYVNKGTKEVIITNAKGSCGCTVPEYDTDPIAPGATGIIKVTFDSKGKPGYNEKNVQITTNGVPSKYKITILAKVN